MHSYQLLVGFQFRRRTVTKPDVAPPHPELTPVQRQHIQARSTSTQGVGPGPSLGVAGAVGGGPVVGVAGAPGQGHIPMRRFNTGGSVAERVMIFERAPTLFGGADPPGIVTDALFSAFTFSKIGIVSGPGLSTTHVHP